MMMKSKKQLFEILEAMNFPKKGERLRNTPVLAASATMEDDILKYEVEFPRGTKTKEVPALLKKFFSTQVVPTVDNLVVRHHDYTVKPKGNNVAVVGAMHILPVARANPSVQEFDLDYSEMEMTNPETYFRKHQCGAINSPQFRAKMFTFVSLMGENYGYGVGKDVYHRRASLIMPKIKITKAVPEAHMMYHTHPRKDEPSLSSPDDFLLYMDLSHEPRKIRHFYTVMADRMDYFQITPKKGSKTNFVKLDEDKLLKEISAEMDEVEAHWDEKMPKSGDYQEDLRYCENITRDMVKWMNKKYSKYFTITYTCHYKVKKNPPEPEIDDLHLNDEILERSLNAIKNRDYSWDAPIKEKAHERYAYWHQIRREDTLQGSARTLGITPQGSHKRTYERYMKKIFEESPYTYFDALNILTLAHDIAMSDSKIRDGVGLASRMEEICAYLELPEEATETLQFLEEVIHNENLFSEEAQTMTGDFYGLALIASYTIQAIGAIDLVKQGKKEFNIIEYEIYSVLKSETQERFQTFLVGELDHRGYAYGENAPISQGFVDSFLNPPQVSLKKVDLEHVFPKEAFAYDFDLVKEALEEFNVEKYDQKKNFHTLGRIHLRFPTTFGKISMSIVRSTGKAQIFVTGRPNAMEDALDAVTKVGTQLVRYGLPGIDPETYDVQAIDIAQNPQTSQVIAIAGPSGAGKSTTIRNLLKLLPNSKTVPTLTTRQKRKSDKPGERIFVSVEQFKKEMNEGDLVAAEMQKNGNYYGRRKSDFENAGYVIIDVNPRGVNAIKRAYPNTFTVYLEPVEDPEFIRKRLLRRGDMTPQEAKARTSIIPSHIKSSKNIDFDARVKTKQGEFAKIALELEPMIPKQNPVFIEEMKKKTKRNPPWAVFIVGKVGDKYAATTRDDGRIGLPGGKVDAGESGKVAVMREATEEGWSFPKETNLTLIHQQDVEGNPIDWYMADTTPSKLSEYKEKHRGIKPILITEEELRNSGFGNENLPLHSKNPVFVIGEEDGNLDLRIVAPTRDPIMIESLRAATDKSFKHHKWYVKHHLDYVKAIAHSLDPTAQPDEIEVINHMVWMHDYPKMLGDNDNFELVRDLVAKHKGQEYADELVGFIDDMERIKSPDWNGKTTLFGALMSTADALAHYYGPFFQIFMDENPDVPLEELKKRNAAKLEKDKRKLRAGLPGQGRLDSIKFQYKGRKVRVVGNEHITGLIERSNPPVRLVSRPSTEDNVSRFFDKNSGKELTGKVFANATLDTSNGLIFEVGEEIKPTEMVGIKRRYNVAKWGDRTVIQRDPRSKEFYERIDFKLPVHLEHDPMSLGEPSAFVTTRGVMVIDRSEDNFTLVHPSEITDFQGNAKNDTNIPIPVYKYAKVVKRSPGIMGGPLENAPNFISARDPQKWSDRYDKIIKMSGDELMELAEKQAAEKGLRVELEVHDGDYEKMTKGRRDFPLPPKYEKLYRKFIESKRGVDILLYRGKTLVDELNFGLITESPKELFDYLESRKRWPKKGAHLPHVANVYKRNRDSSPTLELKVFFTVAATQNKKRFPISVAGGGGYRMSEGQTSKGYYGIIKTYQAGFLEANNMEQYGMGVSPMRSDLYQSYGWLTAFSYKDNYPYPSRAAEYYLNLHGTTKLANKDADYQDIYRPVYSRKMTGPAYRAGVKKMLKTISNPTEDDEDPLFPPDFEPDFEPDFPDAEEDAEDNPSKKITPTYVRKHPNTLFVFGDNDMRRGKGGQAVNRDEPNAIGFRTKHKPTTNADAYYSDDNYADNIHKMQEDLDNIKRLSTNYDSVYFIQGIGEGRALLKEKAPKTYQWMKDNLPKVNPSDGVYSYEYEAIEAAQKLANETGRKQNVMAILYMEEDGYSEVEYEITEEDVFAGPSNWLVKTLEPEKTRDNPQVKDSEIHGLGIFADEDIEKGDRVLGNEDVRHLNHSAQPNLTARYTDDYNDVDYVANQPIKEGSELTLNYKQLAKLTGHPAANKDVTPETLFNPSEWRHGEFAEDDPFEEYF